MSQIALQHYLAVGAIMFVIGLIGFMTRRNLIIIFLCTELMFQGVAINLIAFGRYWGNLGGQCDSIPFEEHLIRELVNHFSLPENRSASVVPKIFYSLEERNDSL